MPDTSAAADPASLLPLSGPTAVRLRRELKALLRPFDLRGVRMIISPPKDVTAGERPM